MQLQKNTKQQKPQSKPPQSNSMTAVRERENRRFWSYILFFFGILELLITFVEGDGLWKWLHELNRGLFGVTVFLFAPMIIYVALMIASDVTHNKVIAKVVEGSVLMLLISGMAQIIQVGSVDGSSFWLKLVGLFNDGKQLRGGGLASALLGWPLLSLFKRVGAGIVIVLVAFTFIMLLTNVTLPQLLKAVSKPFAKSYKLGEPSVSSVRLSLRSLQERRRSQGVMVGLILQNSILMMTLILRRKPLCLLQRRKKLPTR